MYIEKSSKEKKLLFSTYTEKEKKYLQSYFQGLKNSIPPKRFTDYRYVNLFDTTIFRDLNILEISFPISRDGDKELLFILQIMFKYGQVEIGKMFSDQNLNKILRTPNFFLSKTHL